VHQSDSPSSVACTELPPIYFQHDGHSRTIVGIERVRTAGTTRTASTASTARTATGEGNTTKGARLDQPKWTYTLIVFDPAQKPVVLQQGWREGTKRWRWECGSARGQWSLGRKSEYCLVCVDWPALQNGNGPTHSSAFDIGAQQIAFGGRGAPSS
jgi:hypothetical protein